MAGTRQQATEGHADGCMGVGEGDEKAEMKKQRAGAVGSSSVKDRVAHGYVNCKRKRCLRVLGNRSGMWSVCVESWLRVQASLTKVHFTALGHAFRLRASAQTFRAAHPQ